MKQSNCKYIVGTQKCQLHRQVRIMSNLADEIIIEPKRKRQRVDDEEKEDRLSDLPDCILLHILSRLVTVQVVRTCILSTRWKHLWKSLPTLILNSHNYYSGYSSGFSTLRSFDKFVYRIMLFRDDSIALRTLEFGRDGGSNSRILNKIISYVFSHSAQLRRLRLSVRGDSSLIMACVSSCRDLTSLKLSLYSNGCYTNRKPLFPKSLNLPALTTLDLTNFTFCDSDNTGRAEPFSTFNSLNSLILCSCAVKDAQILCISNATLANLTMEICYYNLTKIELSAPRLCTFTSTDTPEYKLRGSIHEFSFPGAAFIKLVARSS